MLLCSDLVEFALHRGREGKAYMFYLRCCHDFQLN
jgi:hypothetical protein